MTLRNAWLSSLVALASAVPHAARAAWIERTEAIMGTRVYVQLWADDPVKGNAAIDAVMTDMQRIDALMSHYKPDSQLSQINAHANSEPVRVDKELFDLIKLSTHYSRITEGAFDITYASVGYLYDYRRHIHPTEAQISKALPAVNWRNLLLDEDGVRYHHIIDPRTGHPAGKVRSATILAPTATQTDGMSKTAFVLGPEKALEIINRMPEYDAVFVCPDGRVLYSNGLRAPLPRPAGAAPAAATATSPRVPP